MGKHRSRRPFEGLGLNSSGFYGRRKGHRLSARKESLLREVFPKIRIDLDATNILLDPQLLFDFRPKEVWLEIGFGGGEHIAYQSQANPDIGIIGVEPFLNGLVSLVDEIQNKNIKNIRIFDKEISILLERLKPNSLSKVFLLFPDPWPKKKHLKRRILNPNFLNILNHLMLEGGEFRFSSDDASYSRLVVELASLREDFSWCPISCRDWQFRPEGSIETRYERKAIQQGRKNTYISLIKTSTL